MMIKDPFQAYEEGAFQSIQGHGLSTVEAKVAAYLHVNPNELSIEEIAEHTGYSLATISNTIKKLEKCMFVIRVKKPGTKKVFAKAERDVFKILETKLKQMQEIEINPIKEHVPVLIKEAKQFIKGKSGKEKTLFKEKIAIMEEKLSQTLLMEKIHHQMIEQCIQAQHKVQK
jgi:DNA-binding transcriptional regulator GbsR (MarR family)